MMIIRAALAAALAPAPGPLVAWAQRVATGSRRWQGRHQTEMLR
jgi:hypothetical protein